MYFIFLRARAVCAHSKLVYFFTFLWVGTVACALTVPVSLTSAHNVGSTGLCVEGAVPAYGSAGPISGLIHDTVVFCAITYKLLFHHIADESWSSRIRTFFSGAGMSQLSRVMLQTGQLYYLCVVILRFFSDDNISDSTCRTTVAMNIITAACVLSPTLPLVLHGAFYLPNAALINIMACRVFRQLRLGILNDTPFTQPTLQSAPIQFLPMQALSRYTGSIEDESTLHSMLRPDRRNRTSRWHEEVVGNRK